VNARSRWFTFLGAVMLGLWAAAPARAQGSGFTGFGGCCGGFSVFGHTGASGVGVPAGLGGASGFSGLCGAMGFSGASGFSGHSGFGTPTTGMCGGCFPSTFGTFSGVSGLSGMTGCFGTACPSFRRRPACNMCGGFCGGLSGCGFGGGLTGCFGGCFGCCGGFGGCFGGVCGNFGCMTTVTQPAIQPQVYSTWKRSPGKAFFHRTYTITLTNDKRVQYVIFYPERPKYLYYYDPEAKAYYARFVLGADNRSCFSLLERKDWKQLLADIPEAAFPPPGPLPQVQFARAVHATMTILRPPEDLPGEELPPSEKLGPEQPATKKKAG
jgi:hypothetical protein